MARSGVPSRPKASTSPRNNTRQALIEAAVEVLKSRGFNGASARAIATEAGVNQALVFYHFGTVAELLLAALDEVSARRLRRYTTELADVTNPVSLIALPTKAVRRVPSAKSGCSPSTAIRSLPPRAAGCSCPSIPNWWTRPASGPSRPAIPASPTNTPDRKSVM